MGWDGLWCGCRLTVRMLGVDREHVRGGGEVACGIVSIWFCSFLGMEELRGEGSGVAVL